MKSKIPFLQRMTQNHIEEGSLMEYQQKQVFLLCLVILFICIPVYAMTIPFPNSNFYYMNGLVLAIASLLTLAYFTGRMKLNTAFSGILFAIQLEICAEIIYCSTLADYSYQRLLIMSNVKLSMLFTMIPVCAYMYRVSLQLSVLAVAAYVACVGLTHGPFLKSYLPFVVLMFVMMSLLGRLLHKNFKSLQTKHDLLKSEEAELLNSLQVSREELYAFAKLVSSSKKGEINNSLLDVLGEQTKDNLYSALAAHFREAQSQSESIREYFPELTNSELIICSLILQDNTVSQISDKLCRTTGNVTSQRSKIRSKLGLDKDENLKDALNLRILEYKNQHKADRKGDKA